MNTAIHRRKTLRHDLLRPCLTLGCALIAFLLIGTIHAVDAGSPAGAVLLSRSPDRTIDLSSFVGHTFLQAMQAGGSGIFDKTNCESNHSVAPSAIFIRVRCE